MRDSICPRWPNALWQQTNLGEENFDFFKTPLSSCQSTSPAIWYYQVCSFSKTWELNKSVSLVPWSWYKCGRRSNYPSRMLCSSHSTFQLPEQPPQPPLLCQIKTSHRTSADSPAEEDAGVFLCEWKQWKGKYFLFVPPWPPTTAKPQCG